MLLTWQYTIQFIMADNFFTPCFEENKNIYWKFDFNHATTVTKILFNFMLFKKCRLRNVKAWNKTRLSEWKPPENLSSWECISQLQRWKEQKNVQQNVYNGMRLCSKTNKMKSIRTYISIISLVTSTFIFTDIIPHNFFLFIVFPLPFSLSFTITKEFNFRTPLSTTKL